MAQWARTMRPKRSADIGALQEVVARLLAAFGREAGPVMALLQPADLMADAGRAPLEWTKTFSGFGGLSKYSATSPCSVSWLPLSASA